jgi:hypothetical protein
VRFVVDKVALEQVFSEFFVYSWQFNFTMAFHTHILSGGFMTGLLVAAVDKHILNP